MQVDEDRIICGAPDKRLAVHAVAGTERVVVEAISFIAGEGCELGPVILAGLEVGILRHGGAILEIGRCPVIARSVLAVS